MGFFYEARTTMMRSPTFVAEIAGNHGGSLKVASRMVDAALASGADVVKFQKRNLDEIRNPDKPRTDIHAFGKTEREHRKFLEFSEDQHYYLKKYVESRGGIYACSAWDYTSFNFLRCLGSKYIKIPSAENMRFLSWGIESIHDFEIHVSLGMTDAGDRRDIMTWCGSRDNRIPYACISKYPTEHSEMCLLEIDDLRVARSGGRVGFSGHHKGIALDVAATILGASFIERHFTLDRTSKGTDHAASLEPDGFRKMVRDIKAVCAAWKHKPDSLPECEAEARKKLKG